MEGGSEPQLAPSLALETLEMLEVLETPESYGMCFCCRQAARFIDVGICGLSSHRCVLLHEYRGRGTFQISVKKHGIEI